MYEKLRLVSKKKKKESSRAETTAAVVIDVACRQNAMRSTPGRVLANSHEAFQSKIKKKKQRKQTQIEKKSKNEVDYKIGRESSVSVARVRHSGTKDARRR